MAKDVKPVGENIQVNEANEAKAAQEAELKAKEESEAKATQEAELKAKAAAEAEALEKKAVELMAGNNVSVIWYCPKRGYWFTKKDLADQYAKSSGITLKKFEK